MAYYTVRYSYTTVRTRLEFSETDLRTVSGYDQFAVNSSQVEFLLTVRTNILVKHHPGHSHCRFKDCGMGLWLVLVSPCLRENVVGKSYKNSFSTYLTHIHTLFFAHPIDFFALPILKKKILIYQVRFLFGMSLQSSVVSLQESLKLVHGDFTKCSCVGAEIQKCK